jgi:divalent metal cation (Fe/Co/Zn/Cd) transporter
MHNGKLYWDEIVGDGYFSNCDQDELEQNADKLGEVTAVGLSRDRGPKLLAKTFNEFITLLEGERTMLTDAERIAEKIEHIVMEAHAKGVKVFALVQKDPQGAIYYTEGDRDVLAGLIEQTLPDFRQNEFEANGVGSISYGI